MGFNTNSWGIGSSVNELIAGIKECLNALRDGKEANAGKLNDKTLAEIMTDVGNTGHNAGQISNIPTGNISANTVQSAINELDAKKVPALVIITSGNCDDLKTSGQFFCDINIINVPESYCIIDVLGNGVVVTHIAKGVTTANMYVRSYVNSVWQQWSKLPTADNPIFTGSTILGASSASGWNMGNLQISPVINEATNNLEFNFRKSDGTQHFIRLNWVTGAVNYN